MPIEYKVIRSPSGHEVVRTLSSGLVTDEEAAEFMNVRRQGGKYYPYPLLAVTAPDVKYTPEARKAFTQIPENPNPQCIVISSAAVRVVINFMMRMSKSSTAGTKLTGKEEEGLAWIDAALAQKKSA